MGHWSFDHHSKKPSPTPTTPEDHHKMETDFRNDAPEGYFLTTGDHKKKTFQTEYELLESIGVGSFSEVKKCRHRHTGNGIRVQKDTKSLTFYIFRICVELSTIT